MSTYYLIDCSVYIFRFYFGQQHSHLSASGREVSTALAFFRWLCHFLKKENPQYVAGFFDESLGTCFRNDLSPEYKSNRPFPDESLAYELLACKKLCELLGVPAYASERYEADDLIACMAHSVAAENTCTRILTRDKDLSQLLVLPNSYCWDYGYSLPIDADAFYDEQGIAPAAMADYLAIVGDNVDAIAGVYGIGKKTAAALLDNYGSWQGIKHNIEAIADLPLRSAARIADLIKEGREQVDANLALTRLATECIAADTMRAERRQSNIKAIQLLLDEWQAPAASYHLLASTNE